VKVEPTAKFVALSFDKVMLVIALVLRHKFTTAAVV
jgi:hypothetical protein